MSFSVTSPSFCATASGRVYITANASANRQWFSAARFRERPGVRTRVGHPLKASIRILMQSCAQRACIVKTRATPRRNFAKPARRGAKVRFSSNSANTE
jgi:hypothetical protein